MTRIAYLACDDHTIFDDNLGFFQRLFLVTDEMKLPLLQEGIIILAIFRLTIKVLPDLMNISHKTTNYWSIFTGVMHVMLKTGFRGCPKQQILDSSTLKEYTDENFNLMKWQKVLQTGRK